ncbi:MAG: nodulation protein NfeD [Acidobacteria bacterium]|nr:nodulation protein NfeD [Acidobacteriota bacterium]
MRIVLAIVGLLTVCGADAAPRVIAVSIDGVVHPVTAEIIARAIDQAQRENAELVLIRLNTPGGLLEATRQSIEHIVASPVPVVTYVTPSGGRAASAGFFVLGAGDVAAMAPGTNTGAAAPILLGKEMDPVLRQKAQNDAAASVRSMAAKRGRNAALAEKAVLESKSFTDKEALENRIIDLVAASETDLFRQLDGRQITRFDGRQQTLRLTGATVVEYEKSLREKIMSAVADPNLALVLMVLGALGVYIEFSSPGLIVPGVAGALLVLLGLSGLALLPINWLGAALLVLALALFVLEAKIVSHGILGAGGALAMVLGALLLIDSPVPEMRIRLSTAVGLAVPFAVITTFLVSLVIRARVSKVFTGTAGMVGEIGVVHTALAPKGKVIVHGEYWDAIAGAPLEAGVRVRVTGIDGLTLSVEPFTGHSGG